MTACIAPQPHPAVVRSDPALRLRDYLSALEFWLRLPDPQLASVVFVDNSGHPLDQVEALRLRYPRIPVEVHSSPPCDIPAGIGYGYAELQLIEWALQHSSRLAGEDLIVKATGRLSFPQLPKLITSLPSATSFAADAVCRQLPWRRTAENGTFRTQLLLFRRRFYQQYLSGLWRDMRPVAGQRFIEDVLYRAVWPLRDTQEVAMRFPVNCSPVGWAAHLPKDYASPSARVVNAGRAVARALVPWIWT